jgi:hypothetical protein
MRSMDDRSEVTLMRCRHTPTQAASAMAARGMEKVAPRSSQMLLSLSPAAAGRIPISRQSEKF